MPLNFIKANSGFINCGSSNNALLPEATATSASAWIYPRSTGGAGNGRIIARINAPTFTAGVFFTIAGTNAISAGCCGNTNVQRDSSDNSFTTNLWQNIIFTWNGSTTATNIRLYVNGVETGYGFTQNGSTLNDNSTIATYIGNELGGARTFDGFMSDVAVWNVVLTLNEIQLLSNSKVFYTPLQVRPSALKGYWPLDNVSDGISSSGLSIRDRSSGGSNGTPSNAAGGSVPLGRAEEVLTYP